MTRKNLRMIKHSGSRSSKVEANPADLMRKQELRDHQMPVTIKVAEAGYVPNFVNVSTQISPNLFTARVKQTDLDRLEADPQVLSLSTPKRMHKVT